MTCIYILLGMYVLSISYVTPFLDINLKKQGMNWEVESITSKNWGDNSGISIGDIILKIDGKSIQDSSGIEYDQSIRGANNLSIQKPNGTIQNIDVKHKDFPAQFYMHFIIPSIYYILILCVVVYLYYFKKQIPFIDILISFMIAVSLAYISSGASARADSIGIIVNSICLILVLILLIDFLKNYYAHLGMKWIFIENVKYLYFIPISIILLLILRIFYPNLNSISSFFVLSFFVLLLITTLLIIVQGYIKNKLKALKILFQGLIVPFLPFLLLFVFPKILFKESILSAEICALFLLLIPFNIIFFQLTERLFDITYHITRFRYYFSIALFFTCWLVTGIYFILDVSLIKLSEIACFLLASIVILLIVKEKFDYCGRRILFTSNGNHIHNLYQSIRKIAKYYHMEEILQELLQEVEQYLELKKVTTITYDLVMEKVNSSSNYLPLVDVSKLQSLDVGEIVKKEHVYIALIHQDTNYKRWLVIEHDHLIHLKAEELLWLELLLTYTNIFIESTKIIEELMDELQRLQQTDINEPTWLKKLVWLRVDEEKFKFAQELHDTFLQEHLHIARQIDLMTFEKNSLVEYSKLKSLHKQMIHSIAELRAYCETLKPRLLTNVGLHEALEKLAEQTLERANFTLDTTFDRLYLEDEQLTLIIYRIVQELFNNAVKHSQASKVKLYLQELENGFEIVYHDDGIGFLLDDLWKTGSLGLQGIRERIEAFNGHISIQSEQGKGLSIQISINEGR